jgi:hypothetical protein
MQNLRHVKGFWKARREELGVEDEAIFQGWD